MLRFFLYLMVAVIACTINLVADSILSNSDVFYRVLADTTAHGLTAGACCFMFSLFNPDISYYRKSILSIAAVFSSSAMDIDHFLAAGSFSLIAATSLSDRPFLHCSTLAIGLVITIGLIESICRRSLAKVQWVWVLFWALFTHQLRDGQRRGLWFCFFDVNTSPISRSVYLVIISLAPAIFSIAISWASSKHDQLGHSTMALV